MEQFFTLKKSNIKNIAFIIVFLLIVSPIIASAQNSNDGEEVFEVINVMKGLNNKMTKSQAVVKLKTYAEKGNSMAMNTIGMAYMYGIGVGIDSTAAINYLIKAGETGNPESYHNLGMMYKDAHAGVKQNFNKACEYFQKGIQVSSVICRYDLGFMHYKGLGCEQDYKKAADLFRQASDYDVAPALYMLGLCYRNGYGVERNDENAKFYLGRAGKLGYADALIELQRKDPENYLQEQVTNDDKKMALPSEMPAINMVANDIKSLPGKYEGFVVMYDWSGKFILGEKPIILNLDKNDSTFVGNLIINKEKIPFEASIDNNGMMYFTNSQLKLGERYTGPEGVDYRMDYMKMEIWSNQISGRLGLYSLKLREPERPMYIEVYRNGKKTMNSLVTSDTINVDERIAVAPNPFESSFDATFRLKNAANNVQARFFNIAGTLEDVINLGDLEGGENKVSITPNLRKGTYVLNIKAGDQVLRTIISKNN